MSEVMSLEAALNQEQINLGAELKNALTRLAENAPTSEFGLKLVLSALNPLLDRVGNETKLASNVATEAMIAVQSEGVEDKDFTVDRAYANLTMIRSIADIEKGRKVAVNTILHLKGSNETKLIIEGPLETDLCSATEAELMEMGVEAFEAGMKRPSDDFELSAWISENNPRRTPNKLAPSIPHWEWLWWSGWNKAYLEQNPIQFDTEYGVDLFENHEHQPELLKNAFAYLDSIVNLEEGSMSYADLNKMLAVLEPIGFTFEYYRDAVPRELRWIGIPVS